MAAAQIDLISNAGATGAAKSCALGGRYLMALAGTVGGATVTVEILGPNGATYLTVDGASLTAVGTKVIFLPWGATVRGAVAGGTPSGLYLTLYRMEG